LGKNDFEYLIPTFIKTQRRTTMDPIISDALQQQQAQTALKVQMSVLQKTQDVQKNLGEALVGLIDSAALQSSGKAIGAGTNFDAFA
jgi:hypothetical protein